MTRRLLIFTEAEAELGAAATWYESKRAGLSVEFVAVHGPVAVAPAQPGSHAGRLGCVARHPRISVDPAVMLGKPVIRGTRIPVELILRKLSEGATQADLLDAYPRLTPEDIRAALAYAADTLAHENIVLPRAG